MDQTANKPTEEETLHLSALDYVAAMTYQTQLNIDCLFNRVMHLKKSPLRDTVLYFVQNQKDWSVKLKKGLKAIGILENMERDLDSVELIYYSIVCEFARQTVDLEAAANLMEYISKAPMIPAHIQARIATILQQGITQDENYWKNRCEAAELYINVMETPAYASGDVTEINAAYNVWKESVTVELVAPAE